MLRLLHSITNEGQYKKLHNTKNVGRKHTQPEGSCIMLLEIDIPSIASEKKLSTKEENVSPCCVHCTYCGWQNGMSQDKAMPSSEKIDLVPLSYAWLKASVSE